MIIDYNLQFSDAQAVTADAASTNVVDIGADIDIGVGEPLSLAITCDVTMGGSSPTVIFKIQTCATAGGTYVDIAASRQVAAMAAGDAVTMAIPDTNLQFVRVYFDVGGSSPTGTFSASIVKDAAQWAAYADAI